MKSFLRFRYVSIRRTMNSNCKCFSLDIELFIIHLSETYKTAHKHLKNIKYYRNSLKCSLIGPKCCSKVERKFF